MSATVAANPKYSGFSGTTLLFELFWRMISAKGGLNRWPFVWNAHHNSAVKIDINRKHLFLGVMSPYLKITTGRGTGKPKKIFWAERAQIKRMARRFCVILL